MTTLNDKVYVATALNILELDKKGNGKPLPIKSPDWGRTTAITALDGKLYCINEEMLYEVDPSGKVVNLGKEWFSIGGMAGLGGKLYIVADEQLYEVDRSTGKYVSLSKDWYNTDGVVALGGKLYIVSRDTLFEVDTLGNRKPLDGAWNDPNGVTVAGDKLYIFHHERTPNGPLINESMLYEVTAAGARKKLELPKGFDRSTGVSALGAAGGKLYLAMPGMSRTVLFTLDLE